METYPYEEEKNIQPSEFLEKSIKAFDFKKDIQMYHKNNIN